MQKRKFPTQIELLFVLDGTDRKGRRVICRCQGTENTIFIDDLADTEILSLVGVDKPELELIQNFLTGR